MATELLKKAEKFLDTILPDLVRLRHKIHQYPEIGYKEYKTVKIIRDTLNRNNITPLSPYLETDVIGFINPDHPGKNVTLRADIDAIKQTESNNFAYKSKVDGMMHGCGHDGHTAILLGTTIILDKLKNSINGSVRYIFQPAEEGLRGAESLMNKEIFSDKKPDAILGLHNFPGSRAGCFTTKSGIMTSSISQIKINIIGKSTHSSIPEKGIDPILVAAEIIKEIDGFSKNPDSPLYKSIIKICSFQSGNTANVIPANAYLEGTARCFDRETEKQIPAILQETIHSICSRHGAKFKFASDAPMPSICNDSELVDLARKNAIELFGKNSWFDLKQPASFSEDFSFFLAKAPGLYVGIGNGEECTNLHTQTFDFNDNIIKTAILFWIKITLEILYKD